MTIVIQEVNRSTLKDAGRCDGMFTVDSQLVLSARNNVIHFDTIPVRPYQKRYPIEAVDYTAYVDHPDRTIFLAYADGQIGGEIRMQRNWNQYAYIEDIVVDVRFRRRGIGRSLILAAVQWAKEKHLPGVMLETQNNNVAACRLYQACGFEIGGFDRLLYRGELPATEEIALYWYFGFRID